MEENSIKECLEKVKALANEAYDKVYAQEYYNWDVKCSLLGELKGYVECADKLLNNLGKIIDNSGNGYVAKTIKWFQEHD